MGCVGFGSCSSYDGAVGGAVETKLPNPDPSNWIINDYWDDGDYLLVDITYPDCTNYEGRKHLLYKGVTLKKLKAQKLIDPHFSESKKYYSPIARFEPTMKGWGMAMKFMEMMSEE